MRRRIAALLLIVAAACSSGAAPSAQSTHEVAGPEGKTVDFTAPPSPGMAPSLRLEGTEYGRGSTGIVIAHEYPASQDAWAAFARELAGKGYHVFTFNFRGYGVSAGSKDPSTAALDLEAVVRSVQARGVSRLALIGGSMGGTAAIIVGARVKPAAVVALSAPEKFEGLDATTDIKQLQSPVLFIAAVADPSGAESSATSLAAGAPNATVKIIEDSAEHASALLTGSHAQDVKTLIFGFLAEHIGG